MLTISRLRDDYDVVIEGLKKRNIENPAALVKDALCLDSERKQLKTDLDNTLAKMNNISKEIGGLFKLGKADEANTLKAQTKGLKDNSKALSERLNEVMAQLQEALYQIPNIPHSSVKQGNSDADNEVIFQIIATEDLPKTELKHWELAKKYDLIDFEMGSKVSGAGFPFYKGKGAALQRALINYFLAFNSKAGYTEIQPPLLINEASGYGTGQLPDKEGQMYRITADDLYLIPTSEVPLINMYRDTILKKDDLPLAYTAYSPCFRREAGSYGAHVRGLNRLHQFDKVEIVRVERPENAYEALDKMVGHVEKLIQSLGLPYRILRLCGGDLGFTAALTFDFEIYSSAQQRWLEVSSVSNVETYQSNRLKLRFVNDEGKKELPHTLNGSSLALPRILAGFLEHHQTASGIKIPEVLVPYTGFDVVN